MSAQGFLFGAAAWCEIPIMLATGWLALRFGAHTVLAVGYCFILVCLMQMSYGICW
ncbi:hypothetical protein [Thaumasiovibrio sp. DFM-14]|uniref:hypothetical protein n=1 Tax=Thaumasiovibrio sp. DFM-14 TaxID=3384792 RepID=UPI0039A2C6F9